MAKTTAPPNLFEVRRDVRGRPKLTMTPLRAEVYAELTRCVSSGQRLTLAELARRCRLYDYRDARRVVEDLKKMGLAA